MSKRFLRKERLGFCEKPGELFPRDTALVEVASAVESMQKAWSVYLARLTDADLARPFEYKSYEGQRYRNTVEEILTQLFGHSLYHRGQIASLIRSIGAEPAVTDFVFWTREPASFARRTPRGGPRPPSRRPK